MINSKDIGKLLKEARAKKGLTVDDVCKKTLIHHKMIENIEEGVFDKLSKVYVKGFIKKYASLLSIDVQEISAKFDSLYEKKDDGEKKEIKKTIKYKSHRADSRAEAERPKNTPTPGRNIRENINSIIIPRREKTKAGAKISMASSEIKNSLIFSVGKVKNIFSFVNIRKFIAPLLIAAAVIAGFLLIIIYGDRFFTRSEKQTFEEIKKIEKDAYQSPLFRESITSPVAAGPVKSDRIPDTKPLAKLKPVKLTLSALGEAWIRIFDGDSTVFVGTLNKGDVRTFTSSSGMLTVWTGKGENLSFMVNDKKIGKVAEGVVRDIKITSEGIRSSEKWLRRF